MKKNRSKRVLFISSAGGHLFQLLQMEPLFNKFEYLLVTEKQETTTELKESYDVKFLLGGTRKNLFIFLFRFTLNILKSFVIFLRFRPHFVITTGVHTAVPMCYIAKIFGRKVIYFETFARVLDKTLAGRLVYPIADLFFVQWESMLNIYPKAIFKGGLY